MAKSDDFMHTSMEWFPDKGSTRGGESNGLKGDPWGTYPRSSSENPEKVIEGGYPTTGDTSLTITDAFPKDQK